MNEWAKRLWGAIHEPRSVSIALFVIYVIYCSAGMYALTNPPQSIGGEIGAGAMSMLALLLIVGGLIGSIAALPGWYQLERFAVVFVGASGMIYFCIVLMLHVQASSGNRLLQVAFIAAATLLLLPRWRRISMRPFRSEVLGENET